MDSLANVGEERRNRYVNRRKKIEKGEMVSLSRKKNAEYIRKYAGDVLASRLEQRLAHFPKRHSDWLLADIVQDLQFHNKPYNFNGGR